MGMGFILSLTKDVIHFEIPEDGFWILNWFGCSNHWSSFKTQQMVNKFSPHHMCFKCVINECPICWYLSATSCRTITRPSCVLNTKRIVRSQLVFRANQQRGLQLRMRIFLVAFSTSVDTPFWNDNGEMGGELPLWGCRRHHRPSGSQPLTFFFENPKNSLLCS